MKNYNAAGTVKFSRAEATLDGINLMRMTEAGWHVHVKLVGWKTVLRWLDEGVYDDEISAGLRLAAALMDGQGRGYTRFTGEQTAVFWRWLVASVFICEQQEKNGVTRIPNDDGGTDLATVYIGKNGGMSVYPSGVRLSLATHVEGLAIEKYGRDEGLQLAAQMYMNMVSVGDEGFCLSAMGREGLTTLHDDYIDMLITEGVPDEPVMH